MENNLFLQTPILQSNKCRWIDKDINNYLGVFELLSDYLDAGSLNKRDVFDYYSEYVLEAYDNKDIQKYIADTRKKGNDDAYFEKFEKMAKQFKEMNERTKK